MDLKEQIKKKGKTISGMASYLGITQSALSQQIINKTITLAKVEKIAEACDCSLSELLNETSGLSKLPKDYELSETSKRSSAYEMSEVTETDNSKTHFEGVCPHCGGPIIVTMIQSTNLTVRKH